ncbi:hypothetical protein VNO78_39598 [Psophocarpus tetragonolobus]|uniref:Uncharacterized protein n=1 Tax=Psophocarpus tetragonolobus TaxID=3891 RepID=A0AAN9N8X5_PSOTE
MIISSFHTGPDRNRVIYILIMRRDIIFMEYDSLSRCLGGEMVDTRDSKSRAKERGGSSPLQGIILRSLIELE